MLEENYIHEDKTKILKWENIISDPECINNSFQTMLVGKEKKKEEEITKGRQYFCRLNLQCFYIIYKPFFC